jgi:MFS family permease
MNNQESLKINDENSGGEFSRHWLLVLVCATGIGVGVSALPFYTQGIFIEAWIADFGWTRAQASLGILGSTLALAAALPFVGLIVDRYGLVTPVMISLLGLSLAYVLLGMFVQSIGTFVMLAVLQATLGSASSPLAYTRAINTVFNKQRGLALGVALSGAGVAATFGPTLISNVHRIIRVARRLLCNGRIYPGSGINHRYRFIASQWRQNTIEYRHRGG